MDSTNTLWTGNDEASLATRIAVLHDVLIPSEHAVAQEMLKDPDRVVENTAQQFADHVGVSRVTVVRTCQHLGYQGYASVRVALVKELAVAAHREARTNPQVEGRSCTLMERIQAQINTVSAVLPHLLDAVDEESLNSIVDELEHADRVLVAGSGFSVTYANELSLRLTSIGRPAEFVADSVGQQVAAQQLGSGSLCFVISGSGENLLSIHAAEAAKQGGAKVIALTSFAGSSLTQHADIVMLVAAGMTTFRTELDRSSRVMYSIVLEALVNTLREDIDSSGTTRESILSVVQEHLDD